MQKFILANWKANLSPAKALQWLTDFKSKYQPNPRLQVVLTPSFLHLPLLVDTFTAADHVSWAAQDVSPYPPGSYTGAIPAAWLKGLADFVLIGHRERRRYFHENVQDIANKAKEAVSAGVKPILCMNREVAGPQIAALDSMDLEKMILAYTPYDADALERAGSLHAVSDTAAYFAKLSGGCPVLYGGGVNAGNVADFLASPHLAGVMTAAGSLDPGDFITLLANAGRAVA
jgi:triosephosphate isomerase